MSSTSTRAFFAQRVRAKRRSRLAVGRLRLWQYAEPDATAREPELDTWELPRSAGAELFQKTPLTDEELERDLARSPLYDALRQQALRRSSCSH